MLKKNRDIFETEKFFTAEAFTARCLFTKTGQIFGASTDPHRTTIKDVGMHTSDTEYG